MIRPTNEITCQTLFLQAAAEGRGELLFGGDGMKTCGCLLPFVRDVPFPSLYLEFPLAGDPFLDITVLYNHVTPGTRFSSKAAEGTGQMIDWFAGVQPAYRDICFGFELDAGSGDSGTAAIHFQPRGNVHLAREFYGTLGMPAAGDLYADLAARMPEGWDLSFFGMFRGRPD